MIPPRPGAWALAILLAGCAHRPPQSADPEPPTPSRLELQRERAQQEGNDQTLETVRLASVALAEGQRDEAEAALRRAVGKMQDFRAEGQFRAMVGAESSKEWKGDPFEKMMAFQMLGVLLYQDGDYGNALAMTKSAILADTGTSRFQYRADFVPAFVLEALVYDQLNEPQSAERSLQQAIDAMYVRELTAHLTGLLTDVRIDVDVRPSAVDAARVLLMEALPAGLAAHPQDAREAIDAALSRATELRGIVLDGAKKDRPDGLRGLSKSDVRASFDALEPMVVAWRAAAEAHPVDVEADLARSARELRTLVSHPPRLLLWVEEGRGPRKVAFGEYREILRYVPRDDASTAPAIRLGGSDVQPVYLDSLTYQASTRGARWVDGFLAGKAQFKDAAPILGWTLVASGDIARAVDDDSPVAAVLYLVGALTWVAGALTNPAADVRAWSELPETLWLVAADPAPGRHRLVVDGRTYEVDVPDRGTVVQWIPSLPPGGAPSFGEPCSACDAPLALPERGQPVQETP
ncbi:MAG: hypothetical protein R3F59_16360 [Myxococcota bacterium]